MNCGYCPALLPKPGDTTLREGAYFRQYNRWCRLTTDTFSDIDHLTPFDLGRFLLQGPLKIFAYGLKGLLRETLGPWDSPSVTYVREKKRNFIQIYIYSVLKIIIIIKYFH